LTAATRKRYSLPGVKPVTSRAAINNSFDSLNEYNKVNYAFKNIKFTAGKLSIKNLKIFSVL